MLGFLNLARNSNKDVGAEFIGEADIPSGPNFTAHYSALPFDSSPANLIDRDISTVDPLAGIQSPAQPLLDPQGVWHDLTAIRAKFPWLPIELFPSTIRTTIITVAGVAGNINVPSGAVMARLSCNVAEWWASFGGRALVPATASNPIANGETTEQSSVYKPSGRWFYCGGVKAIGFVSTLPLALCQVEFWTL